MTTTDPADATPDGYATAIAELESILDELEGDELDVDVLSTRVARAAELIRFCRGRIDAAELEVEHIVADLDTPSPASDEG